MRKLPLFFTFMATCFLCAIAGEDEVQTLTGHLIDGVGVSEDVTKQLKAAAGKVDQVLKDAEKKMEEITEKIGSLGVQSTQLTKEAFDKYDKVKKSLRISRRKLRKLADKTKSACEEQEMYLDGWDDKVDNDHKRMYLKEQFALMENLMKDSLKILSEAEDHYEEAIGDIVAVNSKLRNFNREMKKMLDENSDEYKKWANGVRAGAYSSAGAVTVGMIVADIFGCLGICSAVGNIVGWGTAVAATETAIAKVMDELQSLERLGESVKNDIGHVKNETQNLINALEKEVDIIGRWKNNAENLDKKIDKIDLSKFERLPLYRNAYQMALVRLRKSAEEYLDQPEQLWDDEDTPTHIRKRRALFF